MNQFNIQFTDLAEQQKKILPQLEKRISNVLAHGRCGPEFCLPMHPYLKADQIHCICDTLLKAVP